MELTNASHPPTVPPTNLSVMKAKGTCMIMARKNQPWNMCSGTLTSTSCRIAEMTNTTMVTCGTRGGPYMRCWSRDMTTYKSADTRPWRTP